MPISRVLTSWLSISKGIKLSKETVGKAVSTSSPPSVSCWFCNIFNFRLASFAFAFCSISSCIFAISFSRSTFCTSSRCFCSSRAFCCSAYGEGGRMCEMRKIGRRLRKRRVVISNDYKKFTVTQVPYLISPAIFSPYLFPFRYLLTFVVCSILLNICSWKLIAPTPLTMLLFAVIYSCTNWAIVNTISCPRFSFINADKFFWRSIRCVLERPRGFRSLMSGATRGYVLGNLKQRKKRKCEMFRIALGNTFK